jgi:hypothetical protein
MLMPLEKKHPMYPHKGASDPWTWDKFDSFAINNLDHQNYGLLLDRIIAIDADSVAAVTLLETRFPETLTCPAQDKHKGRHYFFLRPVIADTRGFFDGARQKEDLDIAVKTICRTGTRGILQVDPSPGKCWIPGRELWSIPLTPPSIELLEFLCKARPKPIEDKANISTSDVPDASFP